MFLSSKNTTGLSGFLNEAEVIPTSSHSTSARRFLATASLTTMAVMMSSHAFAADSQSVPSECSPTMPAAGQTVTCSGEITAPISTDVDDLTLVITDDTTVTVEDNPAVSVSGSGDLTVSAAANSTITGGQGIEVTHTGAGTTTITAGDTTGELTSFDSFSYSYNIFLDNLNFVPTSVTITEGRPNGSGISVYNAAGGGAVNITSSGTATGDEQGIEVRSYAASDVAITAEDTYANGLSSYERVQTYMTLGATIPPATTTRDYFVGRGIEVDHRGGDGDVNITSTGSATGAGAGIRVSAFGSSNITISAEDSTGLNNYSSGIEAFLSEDLSESYRLEVVSPATGDIDITSNGTVSGGDDGIYVRNEGSGATTITVNNVQTTGVEEVLELDFGDAAIVRTKEGELEPQTVPMGNAIRAEGGEGDVNVTASGTVSGGDNGILVTTSGAGNIDVSTQGVVTGQNESGAGIYAAIGGDILGPFSVNSGSSSFGNITITSNEAVSGGSGGIIAGNFGTGTIAINAGDVTATSLGGFGPFGPGVDFVDDRRLSVSAAPISQAVFIEPSNEAEFIQIEPVRSIDRPTLPSYGLGAIGGFGSGDINVTSTGTVSGGDAGIHVRNYGQGQTNVNAVNVIATDDNGAAIDVRHGFEIGGEYGGELSAFVVPVSQTVSDPTEHDVTVTASGTVTGGRSGIEVSNIGIGATTVTAVDSTGYSVETREYTPFFGGEQTVTVERSIGYGINVYGGETSGDLTVTSTGTASGGEGGINARNNGTGATTITAVNATSDGFGEYYSFNYSQVSRFSSGTGIYAYGGENSGDLTVTSTGTVSGGNDAIEVRNRGVNDTTVNAVDTTGGSENRSFSRAIDVDVDSRNGQISSGDVLVNSTGTATGTYTGIRVRAETTGSITVNAVDVMAVAPYGSDYGYGYGYGIRATNDIFRADSADFTTGDLTVTSTGTVTGGESGIYARQRGTGDLIVEAVDAIGLNDFGEGIDVRSSTTFISDMPNAIPSGDIIVSSTGNAQGGRYGIRARNYGTGSINIDAVNAVADGDASSYSGSSDTGARFTAISARSGENGGDITITTTGDVDGSLRGINLRNEADALSTINVEGTVTGVINGVRTQTVNGATVNLSEGASITADFSAIDTFDAFEVSQEEVLTLVAAISGPNEGAADILNLAGTVDGDVFTNDGIDTVNLESTGSLNGLTILGDGDDIFNDNGGAFTTVIGGANTDTFNVNAGGRIFSDPTTPNTFLTGAINSVTGFEIFNLNNGISSFVDFHRDIDVINVADGAELNLADGAFIAGNATIMNAGAVNIAGAGVGRAVVGSFEQTETGSISFDRISETEADLLRVTGDVTLGGTLNLNQTGVFLDTVTLIGGEVGSGGELSGSFDQVNGLADGVFITQDIEIDTLNNDVNLVTTVLEENNTAFTDSLTPNQLSLVEDLGGGLRDGTLDDGLGDIATGLGILSSPEEVAQLVEELSPEFASVGLQNVQSLSADFTTSLVNRATLNQNIGGGATQTASLFPSAGINQNDGPRAWLNAGFISVEQDGSDNTVDFETDGYEFAIGISNIDAGPASLGFAAGYSEFDTETSADAFGGAGADDIDTELLLLGAHARFDINESGSGINGHFDVAVSYADGEHDFTQNIAAGGVGAGVTQRGETDVSHIGAVARATFGGLNGEAWPIKPYVKAGVDNYDQDAFTIGTGATALDISGIDNTRYSVGYGANYKHALENSTYFRVGASGTHFFGDTEGELISSFSGAADSGFSTVGDDVDSQFVVEGGIGTTFEGWTIEASGFGQFGDLEGYGGNLNFSTNF